MENELTNNLFIESLEKSLGLSEIIVSYKVKPDRLIRITHSSEAFYVLFSLFNKDIICLKEEFFLLLLNRAKYVLGWYKLSSGGTTGTFVDPKLIFMLALRTNADSILLAHNHPSGNLSPSDLDISLTKRIAEACKLFGITLLDHLIVSADERYYSFSDEGVV